MSDVRKSEGEVGADADASSATMASEAALAAGGAETGMAGTNGTHLAPPVVAPVEEEVPEAVRQAMSAASAAEAVGTDKGIEAWRKLVAAHPDLKAPRAELARVYRQAERWTALVELYKEQVEKLPQYDAAEKVRALFDLVEIYRDKLKLDVMVLNTYNAILAQQPGNQQALDALAAQYEHMKRWPDLINALQKKAALAGTVDEQVALYTRVATLYQEKFSNAAEAIKAYEKVLELDPQNGAAITFLKSSYEKRRDWEKLLGVHQREIEREPDADERGRRYVEVARLASEKLKKPAVSIELWSKVLDSSPDHPEALAELEKLYEREKQWDRLAEVCERQAVATTDPAKKVALLQKLGILFADKINDPTRAVGAWRALLGVEPENKRAQDALKKLYLAQKAWPELEAFYGAQGKIDEYVRVLERQVETEDDAGKLALSMRIAELYREPLAKPDRATRAYEKVLQLDPQNLAAAEALVPLYESQKDPRKLAGVLEIRLGHTTDGHERTAQIRRLAELSETQLRDKAAAFGWALKGFAEERRAGVPLAEAWAPPVAERLARETGGFVELVTAYEMAYGTFPSERDALPLLATVARLYEEDLGDERALATNQRILALDERNVDAIAALERLYLGGQRYDDLLTIFERKLALEHDPAAQKEIRYRIASVIEEDLQDPQRAVDAYAAILSDAGDELPALRALDRIFTHTSRWKELADVLGRELALVGHPDTGGDAGAWSDLLFRLGALREDHLGDAPGAIEAYRQILAVTPSHGGARERLERHLGAGPHQLVAAGILEPIYEQSAEWPLLVEAHEIQLRHAPDAPARVALLGRVGQLYAQRLADPDRAFQAYSRAFREDPASAPVRRELDQLAAVGEKWTELVALYDSALAPEAPVALDPALQRELLLKIAEVHDERLGNADKAVESYKRAQSIAPDDLASLQALEKLYQRTERWTDLLDVYRRMAELTDDRDARESLFFQIATLQEEMLGSADDAIATYKEVLAHDDGNVKALRALDHLYQSRSAWHELADNLSRQLALTSDKEETVPLLLRLAALREEKLGEVAAAVDTYRQVIELDPSSDRAIAALERLQATPEHELAVAHILEPIYQARDEWTKLVGVHEIVVRHTLDPARKIELLHKIGELEELGGGDEEAAFRTYARALREDPSTQETQSRLERIARGLERWPDLVKLYQDVVGTVTDEQLKVQLYTRVAQIDETHLADFAAAADAYKSVLAVDAGNLAAADALEAIYLRTDDYPKLVEVVLRKVEMVQDPAEKKRLLFKAAQIHEEVLESADAAIGDFRAVLELDENDTHAIDALERLYVRLGRWVELKDIYRKKAELAPSVDEKKQMYFVLGQVYDRELKDVTKAIETYQLILDLDPDDYQAIQALDRLYAQAGRWYDLLQVLEREVELSQSTGETTSLKFRIGELWQKELKDTGRAVESYREALALDPGHQATLLALDGIVHGAEEPLAAARVLEPIYEALGEWERLVDVYEVMVKHADTPARRVELLHRIAELHERRLGKASHAFDAFGRAFRDDSTHQETVLQLERLARETGTWNALVAHYEEELARLLEPHRQVEMLLRTARVYEEELHEPERAIASYRRVLDADPEQKTAILALDRLYQAGEKWTELVDVLRREIHAATSDHEVTSLQFRLGQLFEVQLKDVDRAIETYREILQADPAHGPTLAALELLFVDEVKPLEIAAVLEPLYRAAEQWEKLVKIHEVQLAKLTDPADRQAMLQRIAEIHEQRLGDLAAAQGAWSRALREAPLAELAGDEVERLAASTLAWDDVAMLYGQILAERGDADTQRRVRLKLARVYMVEQKDAARAEEAYQRVLELDPRDPDALAALDRLYEASGMYTELAEILGRRIGVATATEDIVELYFRLGRIYAVGLDAPDHAVASYNAILELDSRNGRALEALERIYFDRRQWRELFATYEKMIDLAQGDAEMADCYAHMAKLASDALGEPDRAVDLWTRVVDLRGEDPVALHELGALHERAERWPDLVDVAERRIRVTHEPREQIALYTWLAPILSERLGRDADALAAWQKVLELDPHDVAALRAVARLHAKASEWEELGATLRRLIDVGQTHAAMGDEELLDLYARLGTLEGETLKRPDAAIDAWKHVLVLDDRSFRAMGALETLYTDEARWEDAIAVLERKARALEQPAERTAVLLHVAELWRDKVGEPRRAAEVYERILAAEPAHLEASRHLEQIYRELESWEKLVELLLARADAVTAPGDRIAVFQDVARVYEEKLGDRDGAFVVLQAAFKEDFSNEATSRELTRIATEANKWPELLTDYTQVVQGIQEPKIAAGLWVKIGRWYGEHLGHQDYAIASVQQALSLDPDNKEALTAIADLYRKTGRWKELADVLAHHATVEEDPQKQVDLHMSIADLYEGDLADPARAVAAYDRAVQADPTALDALHALERLHRRGERWGDVAAVLRRKVELAEKAGDSDTAIQLRQQLGALEETHLDDAEAAIRSYKGVLALAPDHLGAMRALERLYNKTGAMQQYLDTLEAELDLVHDDADRVALLERIAATFEHHFQKADRAWEALEKILHINDRHEPTLVSLERLYRQERRFVELVDTYRRHIHAVQDPAARVELYARMGEVYETELKDADRAIEAYNDILAFDPNHTGALAALGRLYERIEDWQRAIDTMSTQVQLTDEARTRVELHHRIGRVYEERLHDPDTAEHRYVEALSLDPGYAPAMVSLTSLYQRRGDWLKAAQMMVKTEAFSPNPVEKVRLLHEAGRIYREKLDDESRAGELFARVIELDPEHVESAEPLADLYFREAEAATAGGETSTAQARWRELEPLLDVLVRKADRKNNADLGPLYYRLARTAHQLGNADKALKYYKAASEIDSSHLPTLLGRAALLYQQEDWDAAFKIYQTILINQSLRDSQNDSDVVEIFFRLGNIKVKVNERKKALNMFEKALELDPHHRPTLLALSELQASQGDFEAVVSAKRALLQIADADERFKLYDEIGDLYAEKVKQPAKAVEAYQEALRLRPDNHVVLHKVLESYYDTGEWKKVVEVLNQFTTLEKSPLIRGKYFEAAAKVLRDELKSPDEAIDYFNRALDSYFESTEALTPDKLATYLKAFEAIDKICTSKKDWKNQERNYRRMIKRLPQSGHEQIKTALWHALGEIYRSRLRDYVTATHAFEAAVGLDPTNMQRHEILAELYVVAGPEYAEKAVGEHMTLIRQTPLRFESYKALYKLYKDTLRQYDKAWCIASALNYAQRADADEAAFYEQYKQKGLVRARQRLSDELWAKNVMHPDEDRYIGAIFGAVWQAVALLKSFEHKQYGLKRKDKLDLNTHQALFTKVFTYVASVLGVQLPEVYLKPERQGGLQLLNLKEKGALLPSVVVGAELLQGRSDKELSFPVAQFLALLRPEHYVKKTLDTNTELRVAFLAALKLVQPQFAVRPQEAPMVEQYAQVMRTTVQPAWLEQLAMVVQRFFAQSKAEIDLARWSAAVDLTGHRAGFILCNDLSLAARYVQLEPTTVGGLQPKDKVKELLLYAISEPYFQLRQELGITIG